MDKFFKNSILLLLLGIAFCSIGGTIYQPIGLFISIIGFFIGLLSSASDK